MAFKLKRINELAVVPVRKSELAAGYDLCSVEKCELKPRSTNLISTGWSLVQLPDGVYGRVAPRSGLGVKGITVGAGVIDADYRGEIKVVLYNLSEQSLIIESQQAIAQLILERNLLAPLCIVDAKEEVTMTQRGDKGFGSTDSSVSCSSNEEKIRQDEILKKIRLAMDDRIAPQKPSSFSSF